MDRPSRVLYWVSGLASKRTCLMIANPKKHELLASDSVMVPPYRMSVAARPDGISSNCLGSITADSKLCAWSANGLQ